MPHPSLIDIFILKYLLTDCEVKYFNSSTFQMLSHVYWILAFLRLNKFSSFVLWCVYLLSKYSFTSIALIYIFAVLAVSHPLGEKAKERKCMEITERKKLPPSFHFITKFLRSFFLWPEIVTLMKVTTKWF